MEKNQKKVKVYGSQEYINANTGEIETFAVTRVEDVDFDFHKVWIKSLLTTVVDGLGTAKIKFAMWLVEQMDSSNRIIMTQQKMMDESGFSHMTISRTLSTLMDYDVLRKQQNGVYVWNPAIVFKGSAKHRAAIANIYSDTPYTPLSNEEKLANIEEQIARLNERATVLKASIELERMNQMKIDQMALDTE